MISKQALHGTILKEKEFQAKLLKSFRESGMFVYKLPDTGFDFKPYDVIAVDLDGQSYHIELKIVSGLSINYSDIRPNQHKALEHVSSLNSASAILMVYSIELNDYVQMTYTEFMSNLNDKKTYKIKLPA